MAHTTLDEAQIRETAYLLWLDEGQPTGRDQEHWLKAIDALTPAKPKRKSVRKTVANSAKKAAPKAAPKAAAKPKAKAASKKKPATKSASQ